MGGADNQTNSRQLIILQVILLAPSDRILHMRKLNCGVPGWREKLLVFRAGRIGGFADADNTFALAHQL